jgi:ABC-2 type transport system permease protein
MRKLWVVTKREYLERVRNRWFAIATVFGPILFGLLMYLPAYLATRSRVSEDVSRIRILDATGTSLGSNIAAELNGGISGDTTRTQVVRVAAADLAQAESTATRAVMQKEIRGYLALGPRVLGGAANPRYAGTNVTAIADMRLLDGIVQREVLGHQLMRAGVEPREAARLKRARVELRPERITSAGRAGSGRISILFAITIAMLLYITIFIYGQNVLRGVIEEKQTRVAEVVVSSVSPTTLLGGKVLGVGAVGLSQMVIWLAASYIMMKFRTSLLAQFGVAAIPMQFPTITVSMVLVLLVFFLLGYTFYAALFAAIGSMVNSEQEAQQAQLPAVMLLVATVMFLQPVLSNPDGMLATILSWLPFSSPIVMPLRMSAVSISAWQITLSILCLVASCYIAVVIAARIYRTGLLMYGKQPELREVIRWMRRAG